MLLHPSPLTLFLSSISSFRNYTNNSSFHISKVHLDCLFLVSFIRMNSASAAASVSAYIIFVISSFRTINNSVSTFQSSFRNVVVWRVRISFESGALLITSYPVSNSETSAGAASVSAYIIFEHPSFRTINNSVSTFQSSFRVILLKSSIYRYCIKLHPSWSSIVQVLLHPSPLTLFLSSQAQDY